MWRSAAAGAYRASATARTARRSGWRSSKACGTPFQLSSPHPTQTPNCWGPPSYIFTNNLHAYTSPSYAMHTLPAFVTALGRHMRNKQPRIANAAVSLLCATLSHTSEAAGIAVNTPGLMEALIKVINDRGGATQPQQHNPMLLTNACGALCNAVGTPERAAALCSRCGASLVRSLVLAVTRSRDWVTRGFAATALARTTHADARAVGELLSIAKRSPQLMAALGEFLVTEAPEKGSQLEDEGTDAKARYTVGSEGGVLHAAALQIVATFCGASGAAGDVQYLRALARTPWLAPTIEGVLREVREASGVWRADEGEGEGRYDGARRVEDKSVPASSSSGPEEFIQQDSKETEQHERDDQQVAVAAASEILEALTATGGSNCRALLRAARGISQAARDAAVAFGAGAEGMAEVAARLLAAAERIERAARQKEQHKKLRQHAQEAAGNAEEQGEKGDDGGDDVHGQQKDQGKGGQEASAATQGAASAQAPASAAGSRAPVMAGGPAAAAASGQPRACSVCGRSEGVLMKCGRCRDPDLLFCSKDCLRLAWSKGHKNECRPRSINA